MSMGDQPDRQPESWIGRIKSALGLNEPSSLREGLEDALHESDASADISPKERALLINVLNMRDVRVSDVMTPRARIVGISEDDTLGDLLAAFRTSELARMPVYGETLDDPKGMIHVRDFLAVLSGPDIEDPRIDPDRLAQRLKDLALLRPLLFVPPSTPALELMVRMQSKRVHMALVIDEYGETDGLVTMEDLVEVIVGDINDEHDMPDPAPIVRLPDQSLAVAGDASLESVEAVIGHSLDSDMPGVELGSIGGYVASLAGRVPQAGETVEGPKGLMFEIVEATPRQVHRLSIRLPAMPDEAAPLTDGPPETSGT